MTSGSNRLDLASIRERLSKTKGKEYWRCLDEIAQSPDFEDFLHREFPRQASEWHDGLGRRRFLQLMGASLALAGFSACIHQPSESIVPYVRQPDEMVLGKPLYYATAMQLSGIAAGLLVESREGRPVKIEGNPSHPASLGSTDIFSQASILTLYDPDRSQSLTYLGAIRPWPAFKGSLVGVLAAQRAQSGAGITILTETVTSPTLAYQIGNILKQYPAAKWRQYEPAGAHSVRAGSMLALGQYANTVYHFDKADTVLSLDSNFLAIGPGSVRYTRDFSKRRKLTSGQREMNRLYVVESALTSTGASADHRLALAPSQIARFAKALAAALGAQAGFASASEPYSENPEWVAAVARDLQKHKGSCIVIAGENQSAEVHALTHAINQALGNVGSSVTYTEPVEANPVDQIASLRDLVQDMDQGKVDALIILGGNPVYDAPADLEFGSHLSKVQFKAHLSLYSDETSELCEWHLPEAHFLESWGDTRAYDGTVSIIQPLIAPLYHGKTAYEVLAAFGAQPDQTTYDILRQYWKTKITGDFEAQWRRSVHDGVVADSALPTKAVSPSGPAAFPPASSSGTAARGPASSGPGTPAPGGASHTMSAGGSSERGSLEIAFATDPTLYDGRFANNGWLQETPKPITKLTWDNAVLLGPALAQKLGLSYEVAWTGGEHGSVVSDMVELEYKGRKLRAAAWIMPGHADNCVTIHLGYGRTRSGKVGNGAGFNAYAIRTSHGLWAGSGLSVKRVDGQYQLACTQYHHGMEGRELLRAGTLAEYEKKPRFAQNEYDDPSRQRSIYPGFEYKEHAWGMAIDLNSCVGCNACVVACQSENNIPVVGKDEVSRGREMHWIRIDQYHNGDMDNPEAFFQPVLCQHCENAPCELVCPVQATVHSAEGLNDMVYNRCVGTRYCSNNCPYKVRRFNFLEYADWETPSLKLLRNPEVTVRSRGVMEKCTYCVQRITQAKIEADKEGRRVRDGEIVTACQAVCPAEAISFGDINDPASQVAKLKAEPRNYGLLADLNTRPRTSYLAVVRNPNPELEKA